MLLIAPVRTPSISGCRAMRPVEAEQAADAISVKPKPSWMPVPNSAVMMISSEKPVRAVGHLAS